MTVTDTTHSSVGKASIEATAGFGHHTSQHHMHHSSSLHHHGRHASSVSSVSHLPLSPVPTPPLPTPPLLVRSLVSAAPE